MKIKSMTASFGKLRGARLELGEGLNLIQAPNEGGKSTWCAFLRAMLYGIPTRERDKQGYIAEKNRYQPWEGGPLEGEVILTWQGRELTLRRGPKGSTPFGAFSATYTDTGEPVSGLTGENCGETLLGVSREVYERSAFVGQGGAAIVHDGELERRIAALVSSGEEDVSYSEVEGKLKEWLRYRRFNKSGLIPKVENDLTQVRENLARQEQAHNQAQDAQREAEGLEKNRKALTAALAAYQGAERKERRERYAAAQSALRAAQADVEATQAAALRLPEAERLRAAQGDLAYYNTLEANRRLAEGQIPPAQAEADRLALDAEDALFSDMTPDEAWQQASRDRDRAAAKMPRSGPFWGAIALFGVAAAWFLYLVVRVVLAQPIAPWMYWVLVGVAMLIITANSVLARKGRLWQAETDDLLEKYAAQYPDDILARANAYRERYVAAREAERKLGQVKAAAADLAAQKEALLGGLLELVHTFEPEVSDLFGVSAAVSKGLALRGKLAEIKVRLEGAKALAESLPRPEEASGDEDAPVPVLPEGVSPQQLAAQLAATEGELSRCQSALAMARGELNTLGDPVVFQAKQEALREELFRRQEEYDALAVALEALSAANGDLQARFSPALNERAGEILSALTGGKYHKVGLNRQFEAQAYEMGGTLPRSPIALSQGAAEQIYLAVRLAVCDLALPGDNPAPLVLDDALDAFDDKRMALALDYLRTLGESRQVLLFSCHSREAAYLKGRADANLISLQS